MNWKKLKYLVFRYGLKWLPDKWFVNFIRLLNAYRFRKEFYWLSDKSFFGQINRIKFKYPDPEMILLADKSKMRERLFDLYGLTNFVKVIGIYNTIDDLLSADLKYPCVIKMNRGSGMNIVLHSKDDLVSKQTLDSIRFWFEVDPFYFSRESHYSIMSPCLVVEEYLGDCLHDYKVFCFDGKPKFIQVDTDRFIGHKRAFYDLDWKLMELGMLYPIPMTEITAPLVLNKMVETASLIAKTFRFIRVDFYVQHEKLLIGECTFFPEGCMGLFDNKTQDEQIGAFFDHNLVIE